MSQQLIDEVIQSGMCVGCGACAYVQPNTFEMKFSELGYWQAIRIEPSHSSPHSRVNTDISSICPMSGVGADETALAEKIFPSLDRDEAIGPYLHNYAFRAPEKFRMSGSSGGFISWLLIKLLQEGLIDAVINVGQRQIACGGPAFSYQIITTEAEIRSASKSKYYSVSLTEALQNLAQSDFKKVALVGVPCFVKAVRTLSSEDESIRKKIKFFIGIFCGHLKSRYFLEYLAMQKGVLPEKLKTFDFREKISGLPASQYGFSYTESTSASDATKHVIPMSSVNGGDWGVGLFKLPGCEYCDDVVAETADVSVGDAWLPEYIDDYRGTNVIVVRNLEIADVISRSRRNGEVWAEEISSGRVAESQNSGLRHRREGLAHRLAMRQKKGLWTPKKRVVPKRAEKFTRGKIYEVRERIALRSNELFQQVTHPAHIGDFEKSIWPLIASYRRLQLIERYSNITLSRIIKKIAKGIFRK